VFTLKNTFLFPSSVPFLVYFAVSSLYWLMSHVMPLVSRSMLVPDSLLAHCIVVTSVFLGWLIMLLLRMAWSLLSYRKNRV